MQQEPSAAHIITADGKYVIDDVKVDGASVEITGSYRWAAAHLRK